MRKSFFNGGRHFSALLGKGLNAGDLQFLFLDLIVYDRSKGVLALLVQSIDPCEVGGDAPGRVISPHL